MKATRFDLEQQILQCWNMCDDLEVVAEAVLDRDMKPDDIVNVLNGIKDLYQLKFEKCFETFENLVSTRQLDSNIAWPFENHNESN